MWNFFRLENEHLNNCGEFRAVRDISVAPLNADDQTLLEQMMDQDDGVRNRQKNRSWKYSQSISLRRPRLASHLFSQTRFLSLLVLFTLLLLIVRFFKSGITFSHKMLSISLSQLLHNTCPVMLFTIILDRKLIQYYFYVCGMCMRTHTLTHIHT